MECEYYKLRTWIRNKWNGCTDVRQKIANEGKSYFYESYTNVPCTYEIYTEFYRNDDECFCGKGCDDGYGEDLNVRTCFCEECWNDAEGRPNTKDERQAAIDAKALKKKRKGEFVDLFKVGEIVRVEVNSSRSISSINIPGWDAFSCPESTTIIFQAKRAKTTSEKKDG
jgi:hypothetical protein